MRSRLRSSISFCRGCRVRGYIFITPLSCEPRWASRSPIGCAHPGSRLPSTIVTSLTTEAVASRHIACRDTLPTVCV